MTISDKSGRDRLEGKVDTTHGFPKLRVLFASFDSYYLDEKRKSALLQRGMSGKCTAGDLHMQTLAANRTCAADRWPQVEAASVLGSLASRCGLTALPVLAVSKYRTTVCTTRQRILVITAVRRCTEKLKHSTGPPAFASWKDTRTISGEVSSRTRDEAAKSLRTGGTLGSSRSHSIVFHWLINTLSSQKDNEKGQCVALVFTFARQ